MKTSAKWTAGCIAVLMSISIAAPVKAESTPVSPVPGFNYQGSNDKGYQFWIKLLGRKYDKAVVHNLQCDV